MRINRKLNEAKATLVLTIAVAAFIVLAFLAVFLVGEYAPLPVQALLLVVFFIGASFVAALSIREAQRHDTHHEALDEVLIKNDERRA